MQNELRKNHDKNNKLTYGFITQRKQSSTSILQRNRKDYLLYEKKSTVELKTLF